MVISMSKKNYKHSKNTKTKKDVGSIAQDTNSLVDYLAFLPGLLMCVMLLIVLILDFAMPGMAEKQYEDFPNTFTVMDYVIIAGGLIFLGIATKRRELHFEKTDVLFGGFALLILLSTFVNGFDLVTIDGVPYRYIGIFNMLAFMLIYMGVTRSIKRESFGRYILIGYLITADLIGIAALYDRASGGIAAFHDKKEISAIFFNGNHYGYFLMMAALIGLAYYLFAEKKPAIFGAASACLNLIILAINHSLGSILAFIVVFVCTGLLILIKERAYIKKFGMFAAVLLVALIAGLIASPSLRAEFTGLASDIGAILSNTAEGSAGHRRLQMWRLTGGYIAEKPFLGYGCEGIALMLYEAMQVSDPHCEPLAYAAYYGIPAALLYLAGVVGVIVTSIRRMDTNGVQQKAACMAAAGYFISSFVGVGMFYTLPFFFIFLGLSLKR